MNTQHIDNIAAKYERGELTHGQLWYALCRVGLGADDELTTIAIGVIADAIEAGRDWQAELRQRQ